MSKRGITQVMRRFGTPVKVIHAGEAREGFAFLQPVPERKERGRQFVPSSLGIVREERFLYLGEANLSLEGMDGGYLRCEGRAYAISSAQAIYLGKTLSHWRAILTLREEEGV